MGGGIRGEKCARVVKYRRVKELKWTVGLSILLSSFQNVVRNLTRRPSDRFFYLKTLTCRATPHSLTLIFTYSQNCIGKTYFVRDDFVRFQ